jgi:hypothetical protein
MYVTGSETVGDPPEGLFWPFTLFCEGGVARSSGFEWWTQYAGRSLDERKLRFNADELRQLDVVRELSLQMELGAKLVVGLLSARESSIEFCLLEASGGRRACSACSAGTPKRGLDCAEFRLPGYAG